MLIVGVHWTHPGFMIAQADVNPPNAIWRQLQQCWLPWGFTQSYLGQPSSCFAYSPYLTVLAILQSVFGASLGQTLTYALPLIAGFIGTYVLMRTLGTGIAGALVSAALYVFNPYTQVMIGLNPTAMVFSALLPWIAMLIVRGAQDGERRFGVRVALFVLFALGVAMLAITPQLLIELVLMLLAWVLIGGIVTPDLRRYAAWALRTLPWIAAACLWWFVPVAISIASAKVARPTNPADTAWTFANASLLNNLRFTPTWMWQHDYYFPFARAYDSFAITYACGFALVVLAIVALCVLRGRMLGVARLCVGGALVALFLAKGAHPPLAPLNFAIEKIPGLYVFQEPAGLIFGAQLALCAAAGLAIDRLAARSFSYGLTAAALAIVSAVIAAGPMITGAIFHGGNETLPSMYVHIPPYWNDLSRALAAVPGSGGVLVLPKDTEYQAAYDWGYTGADTIAQSMTDRRVMLPGPPFGYLTSPTRETVYAHVQRLVRMRSPLASAVLHDLGIRFILFRGDVAEYDGTSAASIAALFPRANVQRFGPLTLFRLGGPAPVFTQSPDWIEQGNTDLTQGDEVELRALEDEHAPRIAAKNARALGAPLLVELSRPNRREPPATAPVRLVRSPQGDRIASSVRWNGGPAQFRASLAQMGESLHTPAPVLWSVRTTANSVPAPSSRVRPLLSVFYLATQNEVQHPAIFNPSGGETTTDVRMTLEDPAALPALLVGRTSYAAVRATGGSATFHGVRLAPGITLIQIVDHRTGDDLRVNPAAIAFERARFAAGVQLAIVQRPQLFHPKTAHALLAGVPVHAEPADAMSLYAMHSSDYPVETQLGALVEIQDPRGAGVCYVSIAWNVPISVQPQVMRCLKANGMSIDAQSLRSTQIVWIGFDAAIVSQRSLTVTPKILDEASATWISPYARTAVLRTPRAFAVNPHFGTYISDDGSTLVGWTADALGVRWSGLHLAPSRTFVHATSNPDVYATARIATLGSSGVRASAPMPSVDGSAVFGGRLDDVTRADEVKQLEIGGVPIPGASPPAVQVDVAQTFPVPTHATVNGAPVGLPPIGGASVSNVQGDGNRLRLALASTPVVSLVTLGAPSHRSAVVPLPSNRGFLGATSVQPQGKGFVTSDVACDWSWIAVQHGTFLPHYCSDKWRNTWRSRDASTITVFNVFDVLPVLFGLVGVAAFAVLMMRRPRTE